MGYYMAVNLRNKIGSGTGMVVCDVNGKVCEQFQSETATVGPSNIVKTAREAIELAVRSAFASLFFSAKETAMPRDNSIHDAEM